MADHDTVVIIGAGLAGAAAAWASTRRGHRVVVLEQFAAGHRHGSSHGSARIVRRAYGDALYTQLTGRALELWDEVESSAPLLRMLGALDFGPRRDVAGVAAHLADAGVAHELLSATEAGRRWPGLRFDGDVLFHAQAGTLDADAAIEAFLASAVERGADVRFGTPVVSVRVERSRAIVQPADGDPLVAATVVVAAGGWLEPLLGGNDDVRLPPLTVTAQPVWHFPRRDPEAPPWPSVIHEAEFGTFYHLAGGRDGGPHDDRKIGQHDPGPIVRAGEPAEVEAASRDRIERYVREWLPGLVPEASSEVTCLYTHTPSQDFVLDRAGPLVVCSPCSGHGAKFAPLTGEYVADLVERRDGVPERFSLAAHARGLGGAVSL